MVGGWVGGGGGVYGKKIGAQLADFDVAIHDALFQFTPPGGRHPLHDACLPRRVPPFA